MANQSLPMGLSLLLDLYVNVDQEHLLGNVPSGERRLYFGATGWFSGPELEGKLVNGGDWLQVRRDGVIVQDVGFLLQTDDGARIAYRHRGMRHDSADVLARWPSGQQAASAPYFFTTPEFETGDARYEWLNRIIAVGRGKKEGLTLQYSVYAVHPSVKMANHGFADD
jgi:hypothetical protein